MRRLPDGPSQLSSSFLPHLLPQESLRAKEEKQDEDNESKDIFILRAECSVGENREIGCRKRFQHAEHHSAQHSARNISDAAKHGSGKGLEPGKKSAVGVDQAVMQTKKHAGQTSHRPANKKS